MNIRAYRDKDGFGLQGTGDKNLYTVKRFMRFVLCTLEGHALPMDGVLWDTVLEWTPDNSHQCNVFQVNLQLRLRTLLDCLH
jgi:hypothetical protein